MDQTRLCLAAAFMILAGPLAGCAVIPGTAAMGPPAGPRFDGVYVGQDVLVSGVDFQCGAPNLPVESDIRNGTFAYPFQVAPPRTAPLPVQVSADGSFFGQMRYGTEEYGPRSRYRTDWVTVYGRIAGPMLEGALVTERCARRMAARHE